MVTNTKIEWTDHTLNLWWGCSKVAHGCKHCYAESLSKRFGNDIWGSNAKRKRIVGALDNLKKIQASAEKANRIDRVFVGSMMDIFEHGKEVLDEPGCLIDYIRDDFFNEITGSSYKNIDFQFLTKRPESIYFSIPMHWRGKDMPSNVWFGASASTQPEYALAVNSLKTFAMNVIENGGQKPNLFLSLEPAIERIVLTLPAKDLIDWIIIGGESGPNARFFDPDWARSMITDCDIAEIPLFVKQMGSFWASRQESVETKKGDDIEEWPVELRHRKDMPPRR